MPGTAKPGDGIAGFEQSGRIERKIFSPDAAGQLRTGLRMGICNWKPMPPGDLSQRHAVGLDVADRRECLSLPVTGKAFFADRSSVR